MLQSGNPWAAVNIQPDKNNKINYGSYNEYGHKWSPDSLQERFSLDNDKEDYHDYLHVPAQEVQTENILHDKGKDDVFLNITIDLNKVEDQNATQEIADKVGNSEDEILDRVSDVFSEKLELLYEKLAALKQLEVLGATAKDSPITPLPPRGKVGRLKKPIALVMRKDTPLYSTPVYNQAFPAYSLNQYSNSIPPNQFSVLKKELRQLDTTKHHKNRKSSMLAILKDQLENLVPKKFQGLIDRKSKRLPKQLPTLPPVFLPPKDRKDQPTLVLANHLPNHQVNLHSNPAALGQVTPPWKHNGLPSEVQTHIQTVKKSPNHPRNVEKSLLSLLLPQFN